MMLIASCRGTLWASTLEDLPLCFLQCLANSKLCKGISPDGGRYFAVFDKLGLGDWYRAYGACPQFAATSADFLAGGCSGGTMCLLVVATLPEH